MKYWKEVFQRRDDLNLLYGLYGPQCRLFAVTAKSSVYVYRGVKDLLRNVDSY